MAQKLIKTYFLIAILLALNISISAANRFFVGTGNWNTTASWSLTSGGASGASIPGVSDIAIFDSNSGNCTINATVSVAGIDTTGFTGTITQGAFTVTVGASNFNWAAGTFSGSASAIISNGVFTLSGGTFTSTSGTFTSAGSFAINAGTFNHNNGTLTFTAAATITNGLFYNLNLNSAAIFTISNNAIVNNTLTFSALTTLNGSAIEARGNIVFTDTTWVGTSKIIANGSGIQTITGAGKCGVTLDVDKASGALNLGANTSISGTTNDLNLISGEFNCSTRTLTLPRNLVITGGTFNADTGTVIFTGAAVTITSGNFYNLTLNGAAQVLTVTNNAIVNNTLTFSAIVTANGSPIEARGNIVFTDTAWNGNSKIIVNGLGVQTFTGAGVCGLTMDVDKSAGIVNLGANTSVTGVTNDLNLINGSFNCSTRTLTLARNLVITGGTFNADTGTVTFTGAAVTIVDGNFYNLTLNGATQVLTVTNNAIVNNTLTFSAIVTANGSPIEARGNIVFTDTAWNGNSRIIVNGLGVQTFTGAGVCGLTMDVDKSAGSVNLGANMSVIGVSNDLNLINGSFNCSTRTLTLARNLVISGGTFNKDTGTVTFTGAAVTIVNGDFYNLTLNGSTQVLTVTNNTIVNNTLTISAIVTMNGSPIEARGNIVFTDTAWNGSSKIIANGTGVQTITGAGVCGVTLDVNKASGSLDLGINKAITGTTNDLNLISGVFNCNNFTLTLPRNLVITGGTFNPDAGTVIFTGTTVTIVDGIFNNLTLNNTAQILNLTNNTIVNNTLTLTALATINGSNLESKGNIVFSDTSWGGASTLIASGTGDQNISGVGDVGNFEINKASGNLIFNSSVLLATGIWTHTAGSIVWNNNTVSVTGNTGTIVNGNFDNLTLNTAALVLTLTNNTIISNTLTITALTTINGSSIEAQGNMVFTDVSWNGSSTLIANGTIDQNMTGLGDVSNFEINKPSGNLIVNNNLIVTRNWTHTLGNINWNNFTVTFNGANGAITSGNFYNLTINNAAIVLTITNNAIVSNGLTLTAVATINGSAIEATGNIVFTDVAWTGTSKILINGTLDQNISGVGEADNLEINKASGNLIFNSSIVARAWTHTAGSLVWNNNSVAFNNTTGTIENGKFYNLILNNATLVLSLTNNTIVDNNLTVTALVSLNGSAIEAKGNILFTDTSWNGSSKLILSGPGMQTNTGAGVCGVPLEINKSSGSLTLGANLTVLGAGVDAKIISGELLLNGFNITVPDEFLVYDKLTLKGNENIRVNSINNSIAFTNPKFTISATSSTIEYVDSAVTSVVTNLSKTFYNLTFGANKTHEIAIGAGNGITVEGTLSSNGDNLNRSILRSVADAASNWEITLNGSSTLTDNVNVKRSDASSSSDIYAIGSVDSGNNTNWIFGDPFITSIVSLTADGSYKTGDNILININFDHTITLIGTMGINLDSGGVVVINGFTGSSATGSYLVTPGHSSLDLNATSVVVNGTARDLLLNNLNTTLPGVNISNGSNIVIDALAPQISAIRSSTANGNYSIGAAISVRMDFSEIITLTGTLTLTLDSGGSVNINSFSGTTVTGIYKVQSGNSSLDLKVNSITINGTASDAALNLLNTALPVSNIDSTSNIIIDTAVPQIVEIVSLTADGVYSTGNIISIRINFSEAINVVGSLNLNLDSGGIVVINSFSGTTATGTYTVIIGNSSPDLTISSINLAGTARDLALNDLSLSLPGLNIGNGSNIVIDTTAPFITSIVSSTADGYYKAGNGIDITISFSESISVTGTMAISLNSGGSLNIGSFSGTQANGIYTILPSQNSPDLSSTLVSFSGTAKDLGGLDLVTTLPITNIDTGSNIVVDTIAPVLSSIVSTTSDGTYGLSASINITANYSEAIILSGTMNVALNSGGNVSITSFINSNQSQINYTVLSGHSTADLSATSVVVNGIASDLAGNLLVSTLPVINIINGSDIVVSTIIPAITSISSGTSNGTYRSGATINVILDFSNSITLVGTMTVTLDSGGSVVISSFDNATQASGVYTVINGQNSVDLNVTNVSVNGTATDVGATNLVLSLPSSNLAVNKNLVIDTQNPIMTSIISSSPDGFYSIGSIINVVVNFNEPLTLVGTLSINLNSGGVVLINSFSNATQASGIYTVLSGHASLDLDVTTVTISGIARDAALNNLSLALPGVTIANNSNIVIDTLIPYISSIQSISASGSYKANSNLNIMISFNESVTLANGTLSVNLSSGGIVSLGAFVGTNCMGVYTVLPGQNTGVLNVTSISLSSGTLQDASNNNVSISLPGTNINPLKSIQIDTIDPIISSSAIASGNAYIDITFSEGVYNLNTGAGGLDASDFTLVFLANGGSASGVSISSVTNTSGGPTISGESTLRLNLSVMGVVSGLETITINSALNSIFDLAGNISPVTATTGAVLLLDQSVPIVSNVTSLTANGAYKQDSIIQIEITFSETITVLGTPYIILETGLIDRTALYSSGSGTNKLLFNYSVQPGDTSSDLEYFATTALVLNGGSIRDIASNNASLVLPILGAVGSLGINKNIIIDTTMPSILSSSLGPNNTYVDITFSEPVFTNSGTSALIIDDFNLLFVSNGGNASGASITSLKTITETPLIGGELMVRVYFSIIGITTGGETITITPVLNSIFDISGNIMPVSETTNSISLISQGTIPTISKIFAVDADGIYGVAKVLTIGVKFSEIVAISGIPYLMLETGLVKRVALYNSGSGSDTLYFKYEVISGDTTKKLDYVDTASLTSGVNIINGITGIKANVTLPATGSLNSLSGSSNIEIETNKLIITGFSTNVPDGVYNSGKLISIQILLSRTAILAGGNTIVNFNSGASVPVTQLNGNIINCSYLVKEGEQSLDLDIDSIELSDGATVKDSLGMDLDLNLPKNTFSSQYNIEIKNTKIDYFIVASVGENGSIFPSGNINVKLGDNKGFTIVPDDGYYISDVIVDGESMGGITNFPFINIKSDHSIYAIFSKVNAEYLITSNAGFGGSVNPSSVSKVFDGKDITFEFTSIPGYHVSNVKVNEVSLGALDSYTFTKVQKDHQILVTFAKDQNNYLVTSNKNGNGSILPIGHQRVLNGADIIYNIQPEAGYHIREVLVDNESKGAINVFTLSNVVDDHKITAIFEKTKPSYQIVASANGGGSISPDSIIEVLPGETKTYAFIPQNGFHLIDVIVDGESKGILKNYTFINVNENHSIIAIFHQTKPFYTIASSVNLGGNAAIDFSKNGNILPGESVSFTVTTEVGYQIIDVKSNNISLIGKNANMKMLKKNKNIGSTTTYLLSAVQADYLIQVEFAKIESDYSININLLGKGLVNTPQSIRIAEGNSQELSFIPAEGHQLANLIVDGKYLGALEYYSFTNIQSNHEVTAIFTKINENYKVSASVTGKGKISPIGENLVASNDSISFTFSPEEGQQMIDLIINGASISKSTGIVPKNGIILSNINMPQTISAIYSKVSSEYKITTIVNAGGTTSSNGTVSVPVGSNHLVQIQPKSGYHIGNILVDGVSIGSASAYLFSNINGDHLIEVFFEADAEFYNVKVTYNENGNVTPGTLIQINAGSNQLIEFLLESQYRIVNVDVNGVSQGPITSYLIKNAQNNQTISVTYTETNKAYSIQAKVIGAGNINPVGFTAVAEGDSMKYNIQANVGSELLDVKIDGVSYGTITSYSFTDISEDHTIEVYFSESSEMVPEIDRDIDSDQTRRNDNRYGCHYSSSASNSNIFELLFLFLILMAFVRLHKRKK